MPAVARVEARVAVIVPASGSGSRLGGERKQFRFLGDAPVFVQTLRVFDEMPQVDLLILAAPEADHAGMKLQIREAGLTTPLRLVAGGATRQASVLAALLAVPESCEAVLVHDAVRPFVRPSEVQRVLDTLGQTGAAALATPVTDTLRRAGAGLFGETIPRDGLYRMQTPQGAWREWFLRAHDLALEQGVEATDDVALLQHAGYPVSLVEGGSLNIKVTTPADWELALTWWPVWRSGKE